MIVLLAWPYSAFLLSRRWYVIASMLVLLFRHTKRATALIVYIMYDDWWPPSTQCRGLPFSSLFHFAALPLHKRSTIAQVPSDCTYAKASFCLRNDWDLSLNASKTLSKWIGSNQWLPVQPSGYDSANVCLPRPRRDAGVQIHH